jgi:hypothetical protein
MMWEIQAWDRHKNVARLNCLMGYQPFPLDNWISNSNTYNQMKKKTCTVVVVSKR